MKVRFIEDHSVAVDGIKVVRYEKGEVASFPSHIAEQLIDANFAELTEDEIAPPPPQNIEVAPQSKAEVSPQPKVNRR